ncbi:3-alpha domain-containing protein [Mycobacterium camsae]|uniref:3-alpha domain-containing protein n=1 Tax=Mycobacterium gordonae TaxID=1778 RepID=UPI001F11C3BE|nr:3-alpha domain-containing protein [Mycobacterium gordonae]
MADVDALLYLPDRNTGQLRKIVDVAALSPGWHQSFTDLLAEQDGVTALHTIRIPDTEVFAAEITDLLAAMPQAIRRVFYTEARSRLHRREVSALDQPSTGTAYLVGVPDTPNHATCQRVSHAASECVTCVPPTSWPD